MYASSVSSALSSLADQVWLACQPILAVIPPVLPFAGNSDDDDDNTIESNQGLSNDNALEAATTVSPHKNPPIAPEPGPVLPPTFLEPNHWPALPDSLPTNCSFCSTIDNPTPPSCLFVIGACNLLSCTDLAEMSLDAICTYGSYMFNVDIPMEPFLSAF